MPATDPPQTLRTMAGLPTAPPPIGRSVVVVIDAQREYLDGRLPLTGLDRALDQIGRVLAAARRAGAPVIHVVQRGRAGGLFASDTGGRIIDRASPIESELIVEKSFPNAFAGTDLQQSIESLGSPAVVLCGFMTHMCVSSTARAALDLGIDTTVIGDACATRPLPSVTGALLPADVIHEAALAELSDRFSAVTDTAGFLG